MHISFYKKYCFINKLETNIIKNLTEKTTVIYRNYNSTHNLQEIVTFKNYCKKKNLKFLISNNIKIALKLNLDGCYFPSFNKNINHLSYKFKKNFLIIGSAHNLNEIRNKELQKVSELFISSIFKKNKNFLGMIRFNNLSNYSKTKIIALGGIDKNNIKKLKLTKCYGFAGISFFKKKGP